MGTLGRAVYTAGFWIRETGQALDRLGSRLQGHYFFQEQLLRHRTFMNVFDKVPVVDKDAFVAPNASIIGDVHVGRSSAIWYGCVLRVLRHRTFMNVFDKVPVVDKDAFVAPNASIIGDVHVGRSSAIWYGCVLRDTTEDSEPPEESDSIYL